MGRPPRPPMAQPPGSATRATPVRASSGPSTTTEARMVDTSSYGASWLATRFTRGRDALCPAAFDVALDVAQVPARADAREALGRHQRRQRPGLLVADLHHEP